MVMDIKQGGDHIKFTEWFTQLFTRAPTEKKMSFDDIAKEIFEAYQDVYIRELAFWSGVNIIANTVGTCEFRTYKYGKAIKGESYWRWNFSPNKNQNSSVFRHKLIGQLYRNNEALVIERGGQWLIADSYTRTQYAVKEDIFSDIQVGDLEINSKFRASDVLFFELNHTDMRPLLNSLHSSYSTLINSAHKGFKWSNGRHGVMNIGTMKAGDPDGKWIETYNQILEKFVKPYLDSDNGILPVFDGYTYEDGSSGQRTQQTTRDIKALIDDIYELTAKAFGIPAALLKGQVEGTKDAVDNLLTFCVDPLCAQLQEEITRKQYGYEGFSNGSYLKIVTTAIKHFDMFENATSVDKLIASGVFCINEIRIAAGEDIIDEPWAWQHFMTKNYNDIEKIQQGGDTD